MKKNILFGMAICAATSSIADTPTWLPGKYEYLANARTIESRGSRVCFYPSTVLLSGLLCFTNEKESKKMLGISDDATGKACETTGTADVVIADYSTAREAVTGFAEALLLQVRKVSPPETMVCN